MCVLQQLSTWGGSSGTIAIYCKSEQSLGSGSEQLWLENQRAVARLPSNLSCRRKFGPIAIQESLQPHCNAAMPGTSQRQKSHHKQHYISILKVKMLGRVDCYSKQKACIWNLSRQSASFSQDQPLGSVSFAPCPSHGHRGLCANIITGILKIYFFLDFPSPEIL